MLAAVQQDERALCCASAELQEDDAVLQASNHMFDDLDRLAERGQLKVLRTLARVRECGRQMNNCLAGTTLMNMPPGHPLVKLDGADGVPLLRSAHSQTVSGRSPGVPEDGWSVW